MVACFGLNEGQQLPRFPHARLAEANPCLDVFQLWREGSLRPGLPLEISGQEIALRSHVMLAAPVFACPQCGRDCYRVYLVAGSWACRTCHKLDYASRHIGQGIPGYSRILYLRRCIKAEPRLFSPIAPKPRNWVRYYRIVAEIRRLEAGLISHLRTQVNDVIERRIAREMK